MDFRYTQDQTDLIDAAKAIFEGENTLQRLRQLVAQQDDDSKPSDIWGQFAELGLIGLMAPESVGGLDQPLVLMTGVAEAAGYVGLPEPLVELAGIVVPILSQMGDLDSLTKVVEGQLSLGVITPLLPFNNYSSQHDGFVVTSEVGAELVSKEAINFQPRRSIDPLRQLSKADRQGVQNTLADHHGTVLSAAQLIGLAKRMVDMSVEYAKDRKQFGQPIGAFQAVKHQLATAYTAVEFARPIIHLAALQGGLAVHNAKLAAIDAAMLAAETAIQVHGGMGYTYEVDLHLFMKRTWALCAEWGDRNYHLKKLQDTVLNGKAKLGSGHTFV